MDRSGTSEDRFGNRSDTCDGSYGIPRQMSRGTPASYPGWSLTFRVAAVPTDGRRS